MDFESVKLSEYCSLKLGGNSKLFRVKNEDDLVYINKHLKENDLRMFVLGEGTNTFFADNLKDDFLVLKMELKGYEIKEEEDFVFLNVKAGEVFDEMVSLSVKNNLWGIENLSHIPGTVGAAPVQNIGAYGVEIKDVVEAIKAYDLIEEKFIVLKNSECDFGYRDSMFKRDTGRYVICDVTFKLSKIRNPVLTYKPLDLLNKESVSVEEIRNEVVRIRKDKLPDYKEHPNAGSFFKNVIITKEKFDELKSKYPNMPSFLDGEFIKVPTAWLIDNVAKMKGIRCGDVGTWPTQPLVLVNYGTDKVKEVINFEEEMRKKIFDEVGITIEREVNLIE